MEVLATAVVGSHDTGAFASGAGTALDVAGSLIADTRPQGSDQRFGRGLAATDGASMNVRASVVAGNREAGVVAYGQGTSLALERSFVVDTQPNEQTQEFGRGVEAFGLASATVSESAVIGNYELGLRAAGKGTSLVVERSLVADTLPLADGSYGVGACASDGSTEIKDSLVARSRTTGRLTGGGRGILANSLVDGVLAGAFHRVEGPIGMEVPIATFVGISDGLVASFGASVDVSNVAVRGVERAGVVFEASSGELRGVRTAGGKFGLVIQGSPKPSASDPSNVFLGSEEASVSDVELPVPGPPKLPTK
jgi:hypothetical protein